MKEVFRKIATKVSNIAGSAWAFTFAFIIIVIWAVTGPLFDFSNTWQLVINTTTTIVTFLMVFLIQNTQNRDGRAMQLKLDELIRATRADDSFIDIEDLSDEELALVTAEFRKIHEKSDHPALKKFHRKLEAVHGKRHKPSGAEQLTNQVVSILSHPIGQHDDESHKHNK
jgi:low affinity Fe/Cu permease